MKKATKLIFLFFIVGKLFAGGFQINEHGARAMGMAGAFTAIANDPTALFYNPAGLAFVGGTHFYGGATLIKPISSFRGPAPSVQEWKMKDLLFNPINIYVTHQLMDNLTLGIGLNNPYGLGTEWDADWVGKYMAIKTEIRTFFFYASVGYKLSDNFSIGAGPIYAMGDVTINRKNSLSPFDADARINLTGDASAVGFTAGLLYKPMNEFSIGLSYRSEVKFDFTGKADVTAPAQLLPLIPKGNVKAPLTTPQNITLGLAYFPSEDLTISSDLQYIGWSSYDKLEVTFEDVKDANGNPVVSSSLRDYNNAMIARVGFEYKLTDPLTLRGGVLYDFNPVKDERLDPTLPDADRLGLNIGIGYKLTENIGIDVAYLFLRFNERKIDNSVESYSAGSAYFNGVYNSTAHLLGIDLSYNF
ncbi:MAG: outer membrane protein transport protein [Ignavibacteriales bacterium]